MIGRTMALALSLALTTGAVQADTTQVEAGQVYYETCGSGLQTLVLIHDGVVDSASFDDMWPILCRDFRVLRYDRRGFGRSPAAKAPYSPQLDLSAVMAAAKIDHATLVGFSFGGGLAINYALNHPSQVDRLIIAGASINGFTTSKQFNDRNLGIAWPMIIGNVDWVIANAAKDPYMLAPGHAAAKARFVSLSKSSPQNFRHQLHDPIQDWPSDLPKLPSLKVPTLILVGDHDIPDVQAMAREAELKIPGATRIVVADAGHLMQLEHPLEVAKLIADFAATPPAAKPGTDKAVAPVH